MYSTVVFCKFSLYPDQQEPFEVFVRVQLWLILGVSSDLLGKREPSQDGFVTLIIL